MTKITLSFDKPVFAVYMHVHFTIINVLIKKKNIRIVSPMHGKQDISCMFKCKRVKVLAIAFTFHGRNLQYTSEPS